MTQQTDKAPPIRVSKEIIWHLNCGTCQYYWTVPTMNEADDPRRRDWHCPLCGTKSGCTDMNEV